MILLREQSLEIILRAPKEFRIKSLLYNYHLMNESRFPDVCQIMCQERHLSPKLRLQLDTIWRSQDRLMNV